MGCLSVREGIRKCRCTNFVQQSQLTENLNLPDSFQKRLVLGLGRFNINITCFFFLRLIKIKQKLQLFDRFLD